MVAGWIRAWKDDSRVYHTPRNRFDYQTAKRAQAEFRRQFVTQLMQDADSNSPALAPLSWDSHVELTGPIMDDDWVEARVDTGSGIVSGFLRRDHVVEIGYVKLFELNRVRKNEDRFKAKFVRSNGETGELLWGDLLQVIRRDNGKATVRARGKIMQIDSDRITQDPLLEIYFIDVGQGDGVLIRYPDGRHMMIDGGSGRDRQMTGKNAADFIDWKFFNDYGNWKIELDWMIASHSDSDHFGGLADLLDKDKESREELDCIAIDVHKFGHPGLSRFPKKIHPDKLGPTQESEGENFFVRLMGDRDDAEKLVAGNGSDGLRMSGPWRRFVKSVLNNSSATEFKRIGISKTDAACGNPPVILDGPDISVDVLAPVVVDVDSLPALPDLGRTGINTNGHSICLMLKYKNARILMTGDLNTASMQWLGKSFGNHMELWKCDVAKACHHGSGDVSFKFLKAINAAATVISSGDNEGHAHPRPEIVAASALSGHKELSDDSDKVITPLVYMTEIERSAMLAEVSRIEIENINEAGRDATILAKPVSEFSSREFFSEEDNEAIDAAGLSEVEKRAITKAAVKAGRKRFRPLEASQEQLGTRANLVGQRPTGVIGTKHTRKSLNRLRIMEANVYGLVNVRTDGETVMCASKRDDGFHWTIHSFSARFSS